MLICPVRGCGQPLVRQQKVCVCPRGHSFDIARSGYINLLQPQDKRSRQPGDTPEAVAARRRLHDRGITRPLLTEIEQLLRPQPGEVILDAGCGDGFYLAEIANNRGCSGHGVDLSIPAINAAARRYPDCEWIVANADRFIPYAGASFDAVLSITARMNSAEFRRVLKPSGRLLVAVPSARDLIQLRGPGRDRVDRTIETFSEHFVLSARGVAVADAQLDAAAIQDILVSIYRPLQSEPPQPGPITFSLDLLLLSPR